MATDESVFNAKQIERYEQLLTDTRIALAAVSGTQVEAALGLMSLHLDEGALRSLVVYMTLRAAGAELFALITEGRDL